MYTLIQFCVLVFVVSEGVGLKQCNDCINYVDCPKALELALNKRIESTKILFKNAFCGSGSYGNMKVPKVCCSDFPTSNNEETPEDKRIANHVNLKLLPEECGIIKGDRIVGGKIADLYEFPWMALISHQSRYGISFKCGGTIINKRYILTAAHCVQNKNIAGVRVGEYDISNDIDCTNGPPPVCERHIQDIPVENIVIHENYKGLPVVANDIALIRLALDVDFNHLNVHRICLPKASELRHKDLSNKIATATGWGITENHTESSILRKVDIPIHTAEHCRSLYNRFAKPGDPDATINQLCAGSANKDSCSGDSGGPLVLEEKYNNVFRYVQYGVVSHGPQRCGSDYPGVYTEVTKFMGWILDNISA